MVQISTFYKTVVYKKILIPPGFFCSFRFTHKAIHIQVIGFFFNSYHPGIVIITQNLNNTLFKVTGFQMKYLLPVTGHGKKHLWKSHGNPYKLIHNMPHFCSIAF